MKKKAVAVEFIPKLNNSTTPVLLKFGNGDLVGISKRNTRCIRTTTKSQTGKAMEMGATVFANEQAYYGEIGQSHLAGTYRCGQTRETKNIRIVAIDEARLNNQMYKDLEEDAKSKVAREISKNELIKKFGGRKAMRYINDSEKSKINVDMVAENLDQMVTDAVVETESADSDINGLRHFDKIRPTFNKDAKKLDEIYDIYDVVPKELLDRMAEEAAIISITPIDDLPISSEFLQTSLQEFQKESPSPQRDLKIKIVIYMDCLLNFLKSRSRSLSTVELSGITEKVENDVRRRFCENNFKKLSKTALTTEKAFCYFLVLALLISKNFEVDINVLKTELNAPRQKIVKYANVINARVKFNSDILTLCLPSKMKTLPTRNFRN